MLVAIAEEKTNNIEDLTRTFDRTNVSMSPKLNPEIGQESQEAEEEAVTMGYFEMDLRVKIASI